jgi:hypothetical protein
MNYRKGLEFVALVGLACHAMAALAQAAGAGADFNRQERRQAQELRRLDRVDPPIRPDPLGNALMGGVVTGTLKGAAAGAASAARGVAISSGVQATRESIDARREENVRSGRGGSADPRYDPRTLLNR